MTEPPLANTNNVSPVANVKMYRNLTAVELQSIFYAITATLVNNHSKH